MKAAELFQRRMSFAALVFPGGKHAIHVSPHKRKQQFLLVGIVAIEGRGLHAYFIGKLAHRHRFIADSCNQMLRSHINCAACSSAI